MSEPHRCDEQCTCPLDGKPLLYARASDQHACVDPECANASGITAPDWAGTYLRWLNRRR